MLKILTNKNRKGFTLIELLVVVAIIGILSSIVLVSVSIARTKTKDTAIKAAMSQIKIAAGSNYTTNYDSVCTESGVGTGDSSLATTYVDFARISANLTKNGVSNICNESAGSAGYCVKVTLNGGGTWCVDSTGYVGSTALCNSTNATCN